MPTIRETPLSGLIRLAGALAGSVVAALSAAETATTNALALKMHATVVPELHLVPPEERGAAVAPADPFSFATGMVYVAESACGNRNSFAIHARNLTMLEAVDLICFLSETPYAFDGNRLVIAPTNLPPIELKQSAKKEKALIDKMKGIAPHMPEVSFLPPATILDALDFLYHASMDYDNPQIPVPKRGINFAVKNPGALIPKEPKPRTLPIVESFPGPMCTFYDNLTNICEAVDARFVIRDNTVVIYPAAEERRDEPGKGR